MTYLLYSRQDVFFFIKIIALLHPIFFNHMKYAKVFSFKSTKYLLILIIFNIIHVISNFLYLIKARIEIVYKNI